MPALVRLACGVLGSSESPLHLPAVAPAPMVLHKFVPQRWHKIKTKKRHFFLDQESLPVFKRFASS